MENSKPDSIESGLRLLRIAPADNVLVIVKTLEAGDRFVIDGREYTAPTRLLLGHKVAARDIAAGEKVIKYGVPIGSATQAIRAGEHVHTHNLQSGYLPTYTLEDGHLFVEEV